MRWRQEERGLKTDPPKLNSHVFHLEQLPQSQVGEMKYTGLKHDLQRKSNFTCATGSCLHVWFLTVCRLSLWPILNYNWPIKCYTWKPLLMAQVNDKILVQIRVVLLRDEYAENR